MPGQINPSMKNTDHNMILANQKLQRLGTFGKRSCEVLMILLGIFQLTVVGTFLLTLSRGVSSAGTQYGYGFDEVTLGVKLGIILGALSFFIGPWLLLILTRKIFAQFVGGSILSGLIAKLLFWLSLICLSTGMIKLSGGIFSFLNYSLKQSILSTSTENRIVKVFDFGPFFSFIEWLLLGLILLGMYWGVRQAISIKEENDLTI